MLRDLRAGELSVLIVAILVAVTAMTAVGFFTDRVGRTIRAQAGAVLAGDLEVRSASPITDDYLDDARALGLETAEVDVFPDHGPVGRVEHAGVAACGDRRLPAARRDADFDRTVRRGRGCRRHPAAGAKPGPSPACSGAWTSTSAPSCRSANRRSRLRACWSTSRARTSAASRSWRPGCWSTSSDLDGFNVVRPGQPHYLPPALRRR